MPSIAQFFRPTTDRMRANAIGYCRDFRFSLTLVCLAALADLVTTVQFMRAEGADNELHPVIRLAGILLGPTVGPVFGKAAQLMAIVIVTVYLRSMARYIFVTVIILYTWAAWYNAWGRQYYEPAFIKWFPL